MEITVEKLLKLESLRTSQVVAGVQGLRNTVKGVTIMEAPDIVDWLAGGELLLTSLYSTLGGKVNYREFIQNLAAKGVSALAIKIRRFVDKIPSEILETADEVDLPIIELEGNVRYVDIMYPAMEMLFNKQVIELKYYKEIQERFTALALQCEGLAKITKTLAELIENPVSIFDNQKKCLHTTDERFHNFEGMTTFYEGDLLSKNFNSYRIKFCDLKEEPVYQVVVPIQALGQVRAYLIVTEINQPMREMDFICLDQATTVVTLEMVRRFAVREVEQKFSNDFVEKLISGEIEVSGIRERANLLELDINHPFVVVLFSLKYLDECLADTKIKQDKIAFQGIKAEIQSLIMNVMRMRMKDFILGHKGDSIIVLWPVKVSSQTIEEIKRAGREVQNNAKKRWKKIMIGIGISNEAAEIEEIPRSYKEAQDALIYGEMLQGEGAISWFQDLGVYRMLCKFGQTNNLDEFLPKALRKLFDYDQQNQTELLKSLQVFLEYNGNSSKAAKALFIHYKTLLYRLERIKEVTGLDLEDNQNRLELELGLKIIQILNHRE
ncbi:sugar diacid utilization regulator [Desulfosporosinus acidiphilus SJ4]|uniref:Sugar diacid utilization regulator n=1 Tax=Desulfosporosinus acidiphilus (strain DSM 22704 / JCM 16185 / SJ4) TaxID=646529 RepID=I4D249_DESAJ|nr:PucR family transcriptional regulator [Desulfosporosinus acidiphilus]AFM39873.1 sugar diacid utilization regulator [Desulfosporosinus acidiphilus SJ4]